MSRSAASLLEKLLWKGLHDRIRYLHEGMPRKEIAALRNGLQNFDPFNRNVSELRRSIACGRPGSEMPHFGKYAYEDKSCYGMSAQELGNKVPPEPHSTTLTKREIEAVADYVIATFVGK